MTRYVLTTAEDVAQRIAADLASEGWEVNHGFEDSSSGWRLSGRKQAHLAEAGDRRAVEAALLLAVRGASIVAWTTSTEHAAELYDGLSRLGPVELADDTPLAEADLAPDQVRMLDLLAGGATQVELCEQLGWSRRTVTRRLADARRALGAETTAQAVVLWRRASSATD